MKPFETSRNAKWFKWQWQKKKNEIKIIAQYLIVLVGLFCTLWSNHCIPIYNRVYLKRERGTASFALCTDLFERKTDSIFNLSDITHWYSSSPSHRIHASLCLLHVAYRDNIKYRQYVYVMVIPNLLSSFHILWHMNLNICIDCVVRCQGCHTLLTLLPLDCSMKLDAFQMNDDFRNVFSIPITWYIAYHFFVVVVLYGLGHVCAGVYAPLFFFDETNNYRVRISCVENVARKCRILFHFFQG